MLCVATSALTLVFGAMRFELESYEPKADVQAQIDSALSGVSADREIDIEIPAVEQEVSPSTGKPQGTDDEGISVEELLAAQGAPVDVGGYYSPDPELAAKAMRPSQTLNDALAALVA